MQRDRDRKLILCVAVVGFDVWKHASRENYELSGVELI